MTPHLSTLLKRLKELDEKRTPGRWLLNNRIHADRRQIITGEAAICCFCCHWDEPNFIIEKVKNDAQFIATLANTHATLLKIIERQQDALKFAFEQFQYAQGKTQSELRDDELIAGKHEIKEALEQVERVAAGEKV